MPSQCPGTSIMTVPNRLRVFLAHATEDKPIVRDIYFLLKHDGFVPWLDQDCLKPGQDWQLEIDKAVTNSHAVVVFISTSGMDRPGYLHKEIDLALDAAARHPEGTVYTIPIKLGDGTLPGRLSHLHCVT